MKLFFSVFSIILVASVLITLGLVLLRKHYVTPERLQEHLHPSVFTFFTALYAFFLGFAIVTLWTAYLTAESNVIREADALLVAFRISKDLPNSEPFRQALADYVKSVVDDEWSKMGESSRMSGEAGRRLDVVWDRFHMMKPRDKGDNDLYVGISKSLGEASRQRLSRASLVTGNLYPPVWVIIVFGFIMVLYGLHFHHLQQNAVRIIFDFMVVFMLICCIYFIYDIDTPFSGYITVKPEVFQQILARMTVAPPQ
jgi:hypothetical protein